MTRFISTRYPSLRMPGIGVRFKDGAAEVTDPDVANRLAASTTTGVRLADGEALPAPTHDSDKEGGDGVPKAPAKSAPVETWRAHILATYDVDEAEVAEMTKAQLQQLAADDE